MSRTFKKSKPAVGFRAAKGQWHPSKAGKKRASHRERRSAAQVIVGDVERGEP